MDSQRRRCLGGAIVVIPYIGYVGYFVRTPIGFILLIAIPAILSRLITLYNGNGLLLLL